MDEGRELWLGLKEDSSVHDDSDLLVYANISTIIRPRAFRIYEKNQVLQTLRLPSSKHFVLFGVVNDNDYNSNACGLGPVKNLRTAAADITQPGVKLDAQTYRLGLRVFARGQQNLIDLPETSSFQTDCNMSKLEEPKWLETGEPAKQFHLARDSKRNQVWPIFHNQDQTLAGKKKDISCIKQERPPRRSSPRKHTLGKKPSQSKKRKHQGKKPLTPKKEGSQARNLKEATRLDHNYRANHPVHTLKIGSLKANMAKIITDGTAGVIITSE
ncbi:hypothetical protein BGZ65_003777 [Modicella reniformis]|uniref:Uncharacterized protein n=1 Tax=Modicella reniformis TaxID=1440133 RepID=A0A9P6J833_9FUNG|nr:hypothetical protein BGZ65_003777 [Modicella reniformis]